MSESINKPKHYTQGGIECIKAIEAALGKDGFVAYCRGNAMKYLWRAGLKGDAAEDLGKAGKYIEFALGAVRTVVEEPFRCSSVRPQSPRYACTVVGVHAIHSMTDKNQVEWEWS